jgi:outer membrane lipoprotein SlyB
MDRPTFVSALPLVLVGAVVLIATGLTGCAATAPHWDARFGDAARQTRAVQVIDPGATTRNRTVVGADGKAVAGAHKAYAESYGYGVKEPTQPALSVNTTVGR